VEVLHVTRVTAASSGTYTSTVMYRAARPSAYTGAPNIRMCDTGGEPRGRRRCPRRYWRYLRDVHPAVPSPVSPPSVLRCYSFYYTYTVCIYVYGYTSGSMAISLTLLHRLCRAVFALLSLLPRHSLASRRAPLNIEPHLLLLYIHVCIYVGVTRCWSSSHLRFGICLAGQSSPSSPVYRPPPSVSSCFFVYCTYTVCIYVCGYTSGSIAISLTLLHRLGRAVFALFSRLPLPPPSVLCCYFVYYTYTVCIYVCGYTSGSTAISLTRSFRLGRAVFTPFSLSSLATLSLPVGPPSV